jgi:predicted ATPase
MHIRRLGFLHERYPTRESYPFKLEQLRKTKTLPLDAAVTCFVGENGTGKSTVLRALARSSGIHIWKHEEGWRVEHNPFEDELYRYVEIEWTQAPVPGAFFSSETFHDFAQILDEWAASDPGQLRYFGGKSLLTLSHGQSLMSFFDARFALRGVYLLDEPETALSPRRQIELLRKLEGWAVKGHAQFVIATHSPILMACRGARLLSFDESPVHPIEYRDTAHYQTYRDFINSIDTA